MPPVQTLADRISAIYNQLADEAQKRFTDDLAVTSHPNILVSVWERSLAGTDGGCGCVDCQCDREGSK